ncbi:MAG: nucleotidyl transferase AbiEii/AbiGii toxin family protein [Nanoarchaeota archaeon]|nr:nucleotidyl transferase AbiEii/AbiGii toxin family protein [Nanoarchaeota archaeon]
MIDKKFIDHIGDKLGIERRDLIEKDILLQMLLNELVKNKDFKDNFAFKGGTCLIKNYFGYFRFSEDLDFTYLNQKEFNGISKKKLRESMSKKINGIGELIEPIAKQFNLDFKLEKENRKYFEFGGSNAFVTFKLWYDSVVLNKLSFIKIQVNFIEKLNYEIKELPAIFILGHKDKKEIETLFPSYSYLIEPTMIKVYDLKEILIEKVRAILTRRGIKARDFVDVFLIVKKEKVNLNDFKKEIIEKISDMLKFEKYTLNIKNKETQLKDDLILGEEEALMLTPIDKGFPKFLKEFDIFLREIINELKI